MIRFSAGLVVVAIGVLIGGIATSKLLLVYVAIGLSAAALLALAIGVVLKREELFAEQQQVPAPAAADASVGKSSSQPNGAVDAPPARVPAAASAAIGEAFPGSDSGGDTADRAGRAPFGQPAYGYSGFGQTGLPAREPLPAREGLPARDWSGGGGSRYAQPGAPGYGADRAGQDTPRSGRHAVPSRSDSPWAPAAPPAPAPAAPPAPAAAAPSAPSAPPVSPVTPPPAAQPSSPVPLWRERPSPSHDDRLGSAASSRPEPGSSAPTWPSWFDRSARPAGDAAAPTEEATPRVPAEGETPSGSSPWPWTSRSAQPAEADESASTPSTPSTASAPDSRDADAATALSEDDRAAESDADVDTPEAADDNAPVPKDGASADVGPALSAAAETDDAEAGNPDRPADPESSPDPVPTDTASTDEADAADDKAGPGERRDDEPAAGQGSSSKQVTVIPGVPRYHDQNCILIRFMADEDVQKMTAREAAEAGCTPCRACQPDLA